MAGLVPAIHAARLSAALTTILKYAFSGDTAATRRRG
jgi:hypothetical protein